MGVLTVNQIVQRSRNILIGQFSRYYIYICINSLDYGFTGRFKVDTPRVRKG